MPDAAVSEEVEAIYARLDAVTAQINENKGEQARLYEQQKECLTELLGRGEKLRVLARRLGVTPGAIDFRVNGAKKKKDA